MASNKIQLVDLPEKHPVDSIQYVFETSGNIPDSETLNQDPVAYLVEKDAPSVNLPGMIVDTSFDDTDKTISVWVRGGTDDHIYKIVGYVDTLSGRRYFFGGKFRVEDLEVPLPPAQQFVEVGTSALQSSVTTVGTSGTVITFTGGTYANPYEVGILRAWLVVDESIGVVTSDIIVSSKSSSGFTLTAPVNGVKVFWMTGVLSQ